MKKLLVLFLALAVVLSMTACGGKVEEETGGDVNVGISQASVDPYSVEGTGGEGTVEVTATKDAYNRLTGENNMASDRVGQRPYAVSVNNIYQSWPQYGTSQADVVVEIETEGGITRMMCLFSDVREVSKVGSVRSLRDQFMEVIYPFDPIIVHIGTSIYADRQIAQYNFRTLDGGNVESTIFTDKVRAQTYATEHTKFTSGESIAAGVADASLVTDTGSDLSMFNFIEEGAEKVVPTDGAANSINYTFSPYYDGDFRYDEASGKYLKWQHNAVQVDAGADNVQLAFDNVILIMAPITYRDNTELIQVDYQAGGTGYYLTQGMYKEIEWKKGDYSSPIELLDPATGEPIEVNTGKTHLGIIRTTYADSIKIA